LDGTRVFHRNDPWGGSSHNYSVYWGREDFDFNLHYMAKFIGEFGFASSPNIESVNKYIPEAELAEWPPKPDESVEYHTPVYNKKDDMDILNRYIPEFLPNTSLENMVVSTQLCQTTALRHTLELARTRRPDATGVCYYKMTDVFPAVSWSTIDYYGVPKMAYHFIKHSYAPLTACALLDALNPMGKAQSLPVWILDDTDALAGRAFNVRLRAYDSSLACVKEEIFAGDGSVMHAKKLGDFYVGDEIAASAPLLISIELFVDGERERGTFYWLNYRSVPGSLFMLPKAEVRLEKKNGAAVITNIGRVPAVGVHFECVKISDSFVCADNYIWLEPGETRTIAVNRDDYDGVQAWNA